MYPTWLKTLTPVAAAVAVAMLAGCGDGASDAAEAGVAVCNDLAAEHFPGDLSADPTVSALQMSRFEMGLPHDIATTESLVASEQRMTEEEDQWRRSLTNTDDGVAVAVGVPLQDYTDRHLDSHVLTRYVRDDDTTLIVISFTEDLDGHEAAISQIVDGRYEVEITEGQYAHDELRRAQDHIASNDDLMWHSTGVGRQRKVGPNQMRAPLYFETIDEAARAAVAEGVDPEFDHLICLEQLGRPRG